MSEIVFYRDTNKPLELTYKDEDGAIVDLTTHTASAKFYDKEGGNLLLNLSNGSGITLGSTEPNISIAFTVNQINALPRRGWTKIDISSGGITERLVSEAFNVLT